MARNNTSPRDSVRDSTGEQRSTSSRESTPEERRNAPLGFGWLCVCLSALASTIGALSGDRGVAIWVTSGLAILAVLSGAASMTKGRTRAGALLILAGCLVPFLFMFLPTLFQLTAAVPNAR